MFLRQECLSYRSDFARRCLGFSLSPLLMCGSLEEIQRRGSNPDRLQEQMGEAVFTRQNRCVEWKVKNAFCVDSRKSQFFGFNGSRWNLRFVGTGTAAKERIEIYLDKTDFEGMLSSKFRVQLFVACKDGKPRFASEWQEWLPRICVWWGYNKDLWRSRDVLLMDGGVTFVCILMPEISREARTETEEKGVQAHMNAEPDASAEGLAADFRRLLDDSTHADVTLKSGGITIPAHRVVLSARSEVFAAMLRSDMEESRSGIVEISDVDPPILDQLVQFIYSGKLSDLTTETAPQLFEAGDKYAVETLKRQCSAFMKENLAEDNACSILVLADAHSDRDLRDCAISFIMDTDLTQKDDIWNRFCGDHPKLAIEVLNRSLKAAKSLK